MHWEWIFFEFTLIYSKKNVQYALADHIHVQQLGTISLSITKSAMQTICLNICYKTYFQTMNPEN